MEASSERGRGHENHRSRFGGVDHADIHGARADAAARGAFPGPPPDTVSVWARNIGSPGIGACAPAGINRMPAAWAVKSPAASPSDSESKSPPPMEVGFARRVF